MKDTQRKEALVDNSNDHSNVGLNNSMFVCVRYKLSISRRKSVPFNATLNHSLLLQRSAAWLSWPSSDCHYGQYIACNIGSGGDIIGGQLIVSPIYS